MFNRTLALIFLFLRNIEGWREMAQQVKTFATKPDYLSFISRTLTVERKKISPVGYPLTFVCKHTYRVERIKLKKTCRGKYLTTLGDHLSPEFPQD